MTVMARSAAGTTTAMMRNAMSIITTITMKNAMSITMTMMRSAMSIITTAMMRNAMGIITMMAAVMSITIIMQTRCLPAGEWKPLFR